MTVKTVGFVGIGRMGSLMSPHISGAGFPVHIYDLNRDAAEAVARAHNGIVVEDSAKPSPKRATPSLPCSPPDRTLPPPRSMRTVSPKGSPKATC